jgi:hypothetical protein
MEEREMMRKIPFFLSLGKHGIKAFYATWAFPLFT